jgi:hypothetical protein
MSGDVSAQTFFSLSPVDTRPRVPSNLARILCEVEPITQRPQREASELREIAESPSTHPEA